MEHGCACARRVGCGIGQNRLSRFTIASMFEARNLKLDLAALALLALVVFLSCALLTYDPADPTVELVYPLNQFYRPDLLTYPPGHLIRNVGGRWGALVADLLLTTLGVGAFYLVLSLAIVTLRLLMRRRISSPLLRAVGWAGSLVGWTTLVAICCPGLSLGPVIGAGGYLGALGRGILELHFATFGALLITLSLIAGGLLLCTDYVLIQLALIVAAVFVDRLLPHRGARQAARANPAKHQSRQQDGPSVRIRGKRAATLADDLADEDGDPDEDDGPEDTLQDDETADEQEEQEDEEGEDEEGGEDEEEGEDGDTADSQSGDPSPALVRIGRRRRLVAVGRSGAEGETERQDVMQQLDEAAQAEDSQDYELPSLDLLLGSETFCFEEHEEGGPPQGQDPGKDVRRFRLQHPRGRDPDRAGHRPVRGGTGGRPAAEQDHRPGRRPGHRPARAQRADRGADPRQEHRGHRGAQQPAADRPPPRGDGGGERQGAKDADPDLPGQGRGRATRWSSTWPPCRTC